MILYKAYAQSGGLISDRGEKIVSSKALKRGMECRIKKTFIPDAMNSAVMVNELLMY